MERPSQLVAMKELPASTAALARENEYYGALWSSPEWSSTQPNGDEQARAGEILRLLDQEVLPAVSARPLKILDLGCGRGWLTALLSTRGEVTGLDPVAASVESARALFPALDFQVASSSELLASRGPQCAHLAVSSEVIEHIPAGHQPTFLGDIFHLLAPGGFAILTTPRGELRSAWARTQTELQPIEDWLSEKALGEICTRVGFTVRQRSRVFVPVTLGGLLQSLVHSRFFARCNARFPRSRIARWLRWHCSIYQVVLLQRPH